MYIIIRRKITILVFLVFFMFNIYLLTVSKVLFMDPRPFMYSLKVQQLQWKCPAEYGNPSGHSWLVFQFYACLVFDLFSRIRKSIWFMIIPIFMGLLIPQSRMYLGAHSSNQVIMGLLIGLCMLVLYRVYLQAKIYHIIHSLLRRKSLEDLLMLVFANISLLILALMVY
jgi:membrane-associated phospholipid phosphatase